MKTLLKEALDAEPFLKYSFILLWILILIAYHLIAIAWIMSIGFLKILFEIFTAGSATAEQNTQWLTDCGIQEQWERDHR